MDKINKTIRLSDAYKAYTYFNDTDKSKFKVFSTKTQFIIRSNIHILTDALKSFEEIRNELSSELNTKYSSDKYSEEAEKDGNKTRKVKTEYLQTYQKEVNEINAKLFEILSERTSVDLFILNLEEIIEKLPDDSDINMEDMDMLSLFEK